MKTPTAFVISHESDAARSKDDKSMNIIALTLARSLGREDVDVVRVHPNLHEYGLSSKYCKAVEVCPDLYTSGDELADFLHDMASRYPGPRVLMPASDDCSLFMARYESRLAEDFVLVNPTAATMEWVRDKHLQYKLADATGVPIPETYFPGSLDEAKEITATLTEFPYIIKPLEAQKWRLSDYSGVSSGKKAITVHTADELVAEFDRIYQHDKDIMIQEIVPGPDENLLTFLGYCSDEHKPLAYCVRRKLRQNPVDFGYCTSTVSCHNDTIVAQATRMLEHSGFRGIVGIEFKYDARTDSYKLIEINTRSVNTTGLAIGCGVNLPFIAFADAIGDAPEPVTDWEDGVTWVRLHQDFSAARELRRRGELTYRQWWKSISGKRTYALFAADDLRPFAEYYVQFLQQRVSRALSLLSPDPAVRKARSSTRPKVSKSG